MSKDYLLGENIGVGYPASGVDQEDVLVAARMSRSALRMKRTQRVGFSVPQVDDLLILALEILRNGAVGIWPTPLFKVIMHASRTEKIYPRE